MTWYNDKKATIGYTCLYSNWKIWWLLRVYTYKKVWNCFIHVVSLLLLIDMVVSISKLRLQQKSLGKGTLFLNGQYIWLYINGNIYYLYGQLYWPYNFCCFSFRWDRKIIFSTTLKYPWNTTGISFYLGRLHIAT